MKKERENWTNDVLESWKGAKRAQPDADVFAKIEKEVFGAKVRTLPAYQWKLAAAAAVLLLMLNVLGIRFYVQNTSAKSGEITQIQTDETLLLSDYQLYE